MAFHLGYNWTLFSDLDFMYRPTSPLSLEGIIQALPAERKNASLIVQAERPCICSCLHLWRNTEWSQAFVKEWLRLGQEDKCCPQHAFDQIAFHALLSDYKRLGWPIQYKLNPQYTDQIIDSNSSDFWATPIGITTSPWLPLRDALFAHAGHKYWTTKEVPFNETTWLK